MRPSERRRRLVWRPVPVHVLFMPAVPVVIIWAGNASEVRTLFPVRLSLLLAAMSIVLTMIITIVQRDVRRSAAIAATTVVSFTTLGRLLDDPTALLTAVVTFTVGAALTVVLFARVPDRAIALFTVFASVISVVLVAANVALALSRQPSEGPTVSPVAPGAVQQVDAETPDVWIISPDRYPNAADLDSIGIDNSSFVTALEERGFQVVNQARANYPQSSLSLASAWSFEYLDLAHRTEPVDFSEAQALLRDPPVARAFSQVGYHYSHVGSWWDPTSRSDTADENLTHVTGGEFLAAWETTTLLPHVRYALDWGEFLTTQHTHQYEHALHQLATFHRLARQEADTPRLVLAHMILPHGPYVFLEDGSPRPHGTVTPSTAAAAYEAQLRFLNNALLDVIDRIQSGPRPAVIMLLADEGIYPEDLVGEDAAVESDPATYTADQIRRKSSILAAVADPTGQVPELAPDTTSVNIMRALGRGLLELDLPPVPDRAYRWANLDKRRLIEIR